MKKLLTNNIGLKILSIMVAALLWLIIININDPIVVETFSNIPVKIVNEDVVTAKGYQYNIETGEKTDIKVKGKRSIVDNLKESEFVAEADFAAMSNNLYLATITVSYPGYTENELVLTPKTEAMRIKLEDSETQAFNVRVELNGEVREGYHVAKTELSSNIIQITGSKTQVGKVKEIVVEIDITGKREAFQLEVEPITYDMDGNVVDTTKISYDQKKLTADVIVFPTKQIQLSLLLKGEPAEGYRALEPSFAPSTVLIAGDREDLNKISSLTIEHDISGLDETKEFTIPLQEAIEKQYKDLYYVVEEGEALVVAVPIEELVKKEFYLQPQDIEVLHLQEDLRPIILTNSITVSAVGSEEIIRNLTIKDIKPYIDLQDCGVGTYQTKLDFDTETDVILEAGELSVQVKTRQD